jgi:hypothetical protein
VYGQQDDFSEIELSETIETTHIRIIAPEAGLKMQHERKSLVYINLMGWVTKEKAEFIFVLFLNGGEHKYDYFINYNYNVSRKEFELVNIKMK